MVADSARSENRDPQNWRTYPTVNKKSGVSHHLITSIIHLCIATTIALVSTKQSRSIIMTTVTEAAQKSSRLPITPLDFNANQPKTIKLYPLSNYTFGTKEHQPEEDPSVTARLKRLEEHYDKHGMRRTCEGILMCHEYNHPHVLMLKIANAFFKLCDLTSSSCAHSC